MMMLQKVYVLMPDQTSGEAFDQTLRENGVDTHAVLVKIAPRVTPDGKLSTSPQVARDLAREIQRAYDQGYRKLAIACNTLQFFVGSALEELPDEVRSGIKIYTTFDSVRQTCPDAHLCPLWIGTKPTAWHVGRHGFKSLYDIGRPDLQELVQEVIWRVKGTSGDDTSSAPDEIKKDIQDKSVLDLKTAQLTGQLKDLGESRYVMGCTELPVALAGNVGPEAVNPAQSLAEWINLESEV